MAQDGQITPQAERPHMPGYGITPEVEGLLAWAWAEEQLVAARNYWVASTRPDGRPHAAPVWGVWLDGALIFGVGDASQKARNIAHNPALVVHLESGDDVVILEGVVERVTDEALLAQMAEVYGAKYPPFTPDPSEPGSLYLQLRPQKALGWREADFPNSATRWRFD